MKCTEYSVATPRTQLGWSQKNLTLFKLHHRSMTMGPTHLDLFNLFDFFNKHIIIAICDNDILLTFGGMHACIRMK